MITCVPVTGIGEVAEGDDLASLLLSATAGLEDGDVLVVTSKVVSKAEGRVVRGDRESALPGETDRVVARRGSTSIVRTRQGLVIAAAGIDASNTPPGTLVLLPEDPDASARRLRESLAAAGAPNVGVLVTDTAGRAWRNGQTDLAIGAAGVVVLEDHAGRVDGYGNELAVTAPAVADEIAGLADLVAGKLSGSPATVVRGLGHLVLPRGEHGTGATALVRAEAQDMFGLGAREAVVAALLREDGRGFGAPASSRELAALAQRVVPGAQVTEVPPAVEVHLAEVPDSKSAERLAVLAFALGWHACPPAEGRAVLRFAPVTP